MNIISTWIKNARSIALPQSFLPAMLAFCLASRQEGVTWWLGILGILGVALGHLSLNLFDDYFDYKIKESGHRTALTRKGFRARMSKCPYLISGESTTKQLFIACIAFAFAAILLSAIIWYFRGNFIFYIAIVTAIIGISYSGPPLRLSYHGWGELLIGFIFGPLLMTGVYYAACGSWSDSLLFISVPVGMLVMNIVYSHAIMDFEPDKEAGKMTFARLLKAPKSMLVFHALLVYLPYVCIVGGIIAKELSSVYLLVFLTAPLAYYQHFLMQEFIKNSNRKFYPKWWMGPMGDWEKFKAGKVDWFMIRWLSARNLLMLFCITVIIAYYLS
jgi:1,4-dihydroxy-2-naphthoate octaprenyltransferase